MAYNDLTPKQQRFVDEYLVDSNATKAMIRAGYSEKWAASNVDKILKNTDVKGAVQERMKELQKPTIATAEEVLEYLTGCLRDGELPPQYRQKAAELLGKRYGLYTERVNVDAESEIKVSVVIDGD